MLFGNLKQRRASSVASLPSSSPVTNPRPTPEDLDKELVWLTIRYGRETLIAALEKLKKRPRGPPRKKDGARLNNQFQRDAKDLLDGKQLRENTVLVRESTKTDPGHSTSSTSRRLFLFLRKNRPLEVRWQVSRMGEVDYPHTAFLAALDSPFFAGLTNPYLDAERERALRVVAEYGEKIGPAPDNMSIAKLTEALAHWTPPQPQGLGGADPFATSVLLALLKGAAGNGTPDGGLSD